mmetsp:Transcript_21921/g.53012  ORF Transcript_21921/g.53012 Transcript_21921/m.53012 type:complete len:207 (-) Transcript_21921:96-716(-)
MAPFLTLTAIGSCFSFAAVVASPAGTLSSSPALVSSQTVKMITNTGNAKKVLHEDSWKSNMSPCAAREYLTTRSTWLKITPDCENGSISDEVDKEFADAWSITSGDGTHILCRNTVQCNCHEKMRRKDGEPCYLSYNIKVTTSKEGAQFTFDIEYELAHDGTVRRTVYDIETIGLKSSLLKPLIRSPLIGMIQEENEKLRNFMLNN